VTTNQQGQGSYEYVTPKSGGIIVECIVNEGNRKIAFNGTTLWIVDKNSTFADESSGNYYYRSTKIIPDKKQYKPGETAHVLVLLPEEDAHLFVTTELQSITNAWHIEARGRSVTIDVPVEERYAPNIYLNITFIKNGEMNSQDAVLTVPATNKILNVEVMSNKSEYKPRESASYTILARNADGSPAAGAEVSLGVVDEAIYSIRGETRGDVRKQFYGRRYNAVQTSLSISYYFSGYSGERPLDFARRQTTKNRNAFADFKNESQYAEPTIRKEFKDTAFWQPDIVTGADGKAIIKVDLPDNLTTWRATVRAVTQDTRVGSTVGKVVARKDLILRMETPRFMTEGDIATFSGIVHNYLKTNKSAKVSIEVTGAQLIDGGNNQTVTIAKDGEFRADWRVSATRAGDVRILARALTNTESDAVEFTLPIIPRGLEQSKGGGTVLQDENTDQTITYDLPSNAHTQARSMRIEVTPSIAGTLFSSLDYLTGYPYGCTEQTMSQFLPNIIVAQALKDVKTASIRASNDLDKKVQRGFDRLYAYQHDDGGWGWWKSDETDPFMTAYVVDGLSLATRAGYAADANAIARGQEKLKSMIEKGKTDKNRPIDVETRAYMVYALKQSGDSDARFMLDLFNKRQELQPFGRALLALALKENGDQVRASQLAEEIERTARVNDFDAHWESRRREMLDFSQINDTEATAMSLKALANINPSSQILPKAARWLVSNRQNGYYWQTTEKTAFAIYGLIDYLKVSKELSPDYSVEIYLNGQEILAKRMTADDAASAQTFVIERKGVELSGSNRLRIVKRGRGTLYLSNTLKYFTDQPEVAAQSTKDLQLTREYLRLRVDEGSEGKPPSWRLEPLSGELRSGDLIVARLTLQGSHAQRLMIEDPIPAGCEQITRISGINLDYSESNWSDWYSAREFRDQKTALFVDFFDGKATFQYAMKVQVPGEFRVGPARAELMYQPGIQSNTATTSLKILDKR
ncbi:MAG: alpha-2-macroglobulin family protein, partial [Pyrinomonadaceae bacterium]